MSRAANNMMMRCFGGELRQEGYTFVAMSPGHVNTDMGSAGGRKPPLEVRTLIAPVVGLRKSAPRLAPSILTSCSFGLSAVGASERQRHAHQPRGPDKAGQRQVPRHQQRRFLQPTPVVRPVPLHTADQSGLRACPCAHSCTGIYTDIDSHTTDTTAKRQRNSVFGGVHAMYLYE